MKPIQFVVGVSDDGSSLIFKRSDPAQPDVFEAELSFAELEQRGFTEASRRIGEAALGILALYHKVEFAKLMPVLPSPTDDDIELAMRLMQRAIAERSKLYVAVIDRLMSVAPGHVASTHPFIQAWPASREIILTYPDEPDTKPG